MIRITIEHVDEHGAVTDVVSADIAAVRFGAVMKAEKWGCRAPDWMKIVTQGRMKTMARELFGFFKCGQQIINREEYLNT